VKAKGSRNQSGRFGGRSGGSLQKVCLGGSDEEANREPLAPKPPPEFGREGLRVFPEGLIKRGSRETEPPGREWLKQVTGLEEEQTARVAENGEGGPKRGGNPRRGAGGPRW
jgi:hypothetical protein